MLLQLASVRLRINLFCLRTAKNASPQDQTGANSLSMKSGPGGFTRLFRVILAENPDGSMPAHTKGLEGNLVVQTQIQSMRMPGPLTGALMS
jgi:hypothetical protein